jgi:hypothetical protein
MPPPSQLEVVVFGSSGSWLRSFRVAWPCARATPADHKQTYCRCDARRRSGDQDRGLDRNAANGTGPEKARSARRRARSGPRTARRSSPRYNKGSASRRCRASSEIPTPCLRGCQAPNFTCTERFGCSHREKHARRSASGSSRSSCRAGLPRTLRFSRGCPDRATDARRRRLQMDKGLQADIPIRLGISGVTAPCRLLAQPGSADHRAIGPLSEEVLPRGNDAPGGSQSDPSET